MRTVRFYVAPATDLYISIFCFAVRFYFVRGWQVSRVHLLMKMIVKEINHEELTLHGQQIDEITVLVSTNKQSRYKDHLLPHFFCAWLVNLVSRTGWQAGDLSL